jgi:hypothetical protein
MAPDTRGEPSIQTGQSDRTSAAFPRRVDAALVATAEGSGLALFFLMLFAPVAYRPLKGALLASLLCILAVRPFVEGRIALHPKVAIGCLLFSFVGTAFVLRGYLAGAPGALRMSTVYVAWPLVYTLLLTGLAEEARLWRLARLMVWTTTAVCLYCVDYVLWAAHLLPDALYLPLDLGQRVNLTTGAFEISIRSLGSLVFLVPFVAAALIVLPRRAPVARRWLWLALALGCPLGLFSGRRALQLVVVLSVPVALTFRQFLPRAVRATGRFRSGKTLFAAAAIVFAVVLAVSMAVGFRFDEARATFQEGFHFSEDPVAHSRALQFDALINGWLSSPVLGSGHGAAAPGVIRSDEMPWAYELTYLALLYHTGVVGFLVYVLGAGWIYGHAIRVIRRGTELAPLMVAVLTGTTTFLIANATNPYLERYDSLWGLFLPLAFVNCSLLSRDGGPVARP